jgi:8-oxo-dGTP diphosphatase
MTATIVQVTAGVIVRDGRFLACQRAAGGWHPGRWEFPGGKVEPGENLEAALRRELYEELDIDASIGALLYRAAHQYAGRAPFALAFFAVPEYRRDIRNRCFADIRWVAANELGNLDFLESDRAFIDAVRDGRVPVIESKLRGH